MRRRERQRRRRRVWQRIALLGLLGIGLFVAVGSLRPQWFLDAEFARQRWWFGAERVDAQAAGHDWSVLRAGSGKTLVLVHGFTGMKENWLPVFEALAGDYRVVAPDLPGWGESSRDPALDYGFPEQAERLAAFMRTLTPGGTPVLLVGHSMGGGIAALVAARHPELVERLVLVDAAGAPFDENEFMRAVLRGEHPYEVLDRRGLDRQLALVFADPPFVPWPVDRALIARRSADVGFERAVLQRLRRDEDANLPHAEAGRIGVPTLLLWCRDDPVIDASALRSWAAAIRDSRSVLLDGCHHMPMMERPADTAAAIKAFLAEPPRG